MTIVLCLVIFMAFLFSWVYVLTKEDEEVRQKRQLIEQLPAFISTLGVLGTFIGITMGLMHFNESDLDSSIPELLSGLKTAFLTSIFGMIGSLVLNHIVNRRFDTLDGQELGMSEMTQKLLNAIWALQTRVEQNSKELKQFCAAASGDKGKDDSGQQSLDTIVACVNQARDDIEQIKVQCKELAEVMNSMAGQNDRAGVTQLTTAESTAAIENTLTEMAEQLKAMAEKIESIEQNAN